MNTKECKYLIVDGCFHDYICAKRRKRLTVGGVVRSYNLGCIDGSCPDFTPKQKNEPITESTSQNPDENAINMNLTQLLGIKKQ